MHAWMIRIDFLSQQECIRAWGPQGTPRV